VRDPSEDRDVDQRHRTESVYLRYDIVSQKDLAIARAKLEAFHTEQREISTRKDNQQNEKPANC